MFVSQTNEQGFEKAQNLARLAFLALNFVRLPIFQA